MFYFLFGLVLSPQCVHDYINTLPIYLKFCLGFGVPPKCVLLWGLGCGRVSAGVIKSGAGLGEGTQGEEWTGK